MSNQLPRKTNASARTPAKPETRSGRTPATNTPTGRSAGSRAPVAPSRTAPRSAQTGTRPRTGGARNQPQRGFKLRNSDIAFLFVGLVIVAGLVWLVLSSANSGTTPTTGTTAGAPPAVTNGSASGNGQATPAQGSGGTSSNAGKPMEQTTPLAAGQVAPDFSLPDTNGTTYTLSQYKGKTVVLEFFATWCPHCQNDAPMMNKLNADYKDKGVVMLGVNGSQFGRNYESKDTSPVTIDDIKWFRDSFTVTFPLLFDPNVTAGLNYGIKGYPTVFMIDKNGVIASQPPYPFAYTDLTAALDKAIASK
jgi:peroxiredoxin